MVGVVVVSKFIQHTNEDKYSGMIDYMDRAEAIKNNNISFKINSVELDNIEKKMVGLMNSLGTTDIDILAEDKKLKNMICFKENLYKKKNSLTRYDVNYIFKTYFKDGILIPEEFNKKFNSINKKKPKIEFENEQKRISTRLGKLEQLEYVSKDAEGNYILTSKAKAEIKNFSEFEFTSYDVNKIFKLIRSNKYIDSIEKKLSLELDLGTKQGKKDYKYILNRIQNNIKHGSLAISNGKYEITKKGLMEEEEILKPHKKYIVKKVKELEEKSSEFKQQKNIIDEKYSLVNELDYSGIVDYMDREKARSTSAKTDIGLFTEEKDILDSPDKNKIKKLFDKSQKNGGIMWHDVISFDNKWLEKYGIYNDKNKVLDNEKLKAVVRNAVKEMLKKEKLDKSAFWCADIHYNTDNLHVHVSTVELHPSKDRGRRKPKSLFTMKSKVINGVMDSSNEYKKISDLIRKNIIEPKKNMDSLGDVHLKNLFLETYKNLPKDRRQWHYNYNSLKPVRPLIDKMTEIYIVKYHKQDLLDLKHILLKQEKNLKEAYGQGKNNFYKNFYENKLKDLKVRMGNTILKELKDYDYILKRYERNLQPQKNNKPINKNQKQNAMKKLFIPHRVDNIKYNLEKDYWNWKSLENTVNNDLDSFKNQQAYRRLEEMGRNE
jgi:hypothetical protein